MLADRISAAACSVFELDRSRPVDAIVIGRAGMDLYPLPDGTKTAEATSFRSDVGGSAANIAVALARQGARVSLLAPLSDDPVGRFVRRTVTGYGVDVSGCKTVQGEHRTSLALAETRATDCEVVIYRNGAADLTLARADITAAQVGQSACLIVTGTALAREPSRSAVFEALSAARTAGTVSILDIDYRPYSWQSEAEASAIYGEAAGMCDVVIGNDDEFAVLAGGKDAQAHARHLATASASLVIFKQGEAGSITFADGEEFATGIIPVAAKKPFGAGDAFMGGLVYALLETCPLREAVARGSAAAAIVVSRLGCASAMPTGKEITSFLSNNKMEGGDAHRTIC